MKNILLLNKIAKVGTDRLDPTVYQLGADVETLGKLLEAHGVGIVFKKSVDVGFFHRLITSFHYYFYIERTGPVCPSPLFSSIASSAS